MLGFEQLIESLSFLIMDEAKTDAGKKTFGGMLDFHFPCSRQKKLENVYLFFTWIISGESNASSGETALRNCYALA